VVAHQVSQDFGYGGGRAEDLKPERAMCPVDRGGVGMVPRGREVLEEGGTQKC
jgi:hypothetical protein